MKIYLASSLNNAERVKELKTLVEDIGYKITYEWYTHGLITDQSVLPEIGKLESQGVIDCDVLLMIQPAALGSHVELGIAIALGKKIIIFEEVEPIQQKPFYFLPGIEKHRNVDDLITALRDHYGQR